MAIAKRISLFLITNILMVATISIVLSVLGVGRWIQGNEIQFGTLAVFCLVWGFGASLFSLLISKPMAKWSMGVKVIDAQERNADLQWVRETTLRLARSAGLPKPPEVGYYESPDMNAFATGPSKGNSLVAVSTGLLHRMNRAEAEGVLAHEVAHIANGDMVTMALLQGVVNAFVMFLARIAAFAVSMAMANRSDDESESAGGANPLVNMVLTFFFEIVLGFFGMMVVAAFSRAREYRADRGGAQLGGRENMIRALQALQRQHLPATAQADSLAAFKISGGGGIARFFSTHPPLEERIAALQQVR